MKTSIWHTFKFGLLILLVLMILPATDALALRFDTAPHFEGAGRLATASQISGEIIISTLDNEKYLPAVAYNSKHDEYLVVWQNKWPGNRDIYAQRISSRGELLSWFAVAPGPGGNAYDRAQPTVAYDPIQDRYLVAFIHDVHGDGSDWNIGGRFIPWNGPDPNLAEFPICTWTSSQWNPSVAFAFTQKEFLVAWTNTPSSLPAYISAARLNSETGIVIDDFTISSGPENRINPDVAYNLARNEYLVVWDFVGSQHDIYGLRLTGSGSALGGGEFAIAGWPDNEEAPTVAACHEADQYLVGWQSLVGPPSNYDVYARYVSGDGTPGTVFLADGTAAPEEAIDATCRQDGRQYLLTWQAMYTGGYYGVWARLVHPGGMEDAFGLVQPGSTANRITPAAAGGRVNYLAVWAHDRDSTAYQDIRGRLVYPNQVYLPMLIK